jgi:hypothetical protein
MNIPLIAITPTTAKMIAKYHRNSNNEGSHIRWLRIALMLHTTQQYNDGFLTEDAMHDGYDTALNGASIDVMLATKIIP